MRAPQSGPPEVGLIRARPPLSALQAAEDLTRGASSLRPGESIARRVVSFSVSVNSSIGGRTGPPT